MAEDLNMEENEQSVDQEDSDEIAGDKMKQAVQCGPDTDVAPKIDIDLVRPMFGLPDRPYQQGAQHQAHAKPRGRNAKPFPDRGVREEIRRQR